MNPCPVLNLDKETRTSKAMLEWPEIQWYGAKWPLMESRPSDLQWERSYSGLPLKGHSQKQYGSKSFDYRTQAACCSFLHMTLSTNSIRAFIFNCTFEKPPEAVYYVENSN